MSENTKSPVRPFGMEFLEEIELPESVLGGVGSMSQNCCTSLQCFPTYVATNPPGDDYSYVGCWGPGDTCVPDESPV